ncbi:hypothetical protein ACK36M_14390 [Aeromonas veronii]
MKKILLFVFFIASMFPWISFRFLDLDMQPFFIISGGLVFILYFTFKFPFEVNFLLVTAFCAFILMIVYGEFDFLSLRAVISYGAVFITAFSYFVLRRHWMRRPINYLILINYIWVFAGIFQLLISKDVLSFLVVARTTLDRGVTSLAPEPTFFGMYLVLLTLFIVKVNNYSFFSIKIKVLLVVNSLSILFIAKSSMAMLFLLLFLFGLFLALISFRKLPLFIVVVFMVSVGVYTSIGFLPDDSRIVRLAAVAMEAPELFFYNDASSNERLKNVVFPLHASISSFFIPHGYHQFIIDSISLKESYGGFFWWGEDSNKIMSGFGALLYELGFLSIPFFVWYIVSLYHSTSVRLFVFESLFLFLIMLMAIPITLPIFSFIVSETYFHRRGYGLK